MSDKRMQISIDVLHIRQGETPPGDTQGRLGSIRGRLQTCSNVYVALAELLGRSSPDSRQPDRATAAIVCVDNLGPAEMEFFTLTARRTPQTPVYVYTERGDHKRVQRAIHLGATGELSDQALSELSEPMVQQATADADDPMHEPDSATDELATDTQSPTEAPVDEDDDAPTSVRVPWLRYEDAPNRGAPTRRPPDHQQAETTADERDDPEGPPVANGPNTAADTEAAEPPQSRAPAHHEPLLTDEELQALIGDDVASITPDVKRPGESEGGDAP